MGADDPTNARPGDLFDLFGKLEFTSSFLGRPDHRIREHVRRDLIEGCRQAEHVVGANVPDGTMVVSDG